jgi:hypothetical protein
LRREKGEGEGQDQDYEEDEEEDSGGGTVFDREDIEVAIDVFISELVNEKVIKKPKARHHPTLVQVFEHVFGEGHPIAKMVETFEEHIEGYFGAIGYDEMNSAYGELLGIRVMINKEIGLHA